MGPVISPLKVSVKVPSVALPFVISTTSSVPSAISRFVSVRMKRLSPDSITVSIPPFPVSVSTPGPPVSWSSPLPPDKVSSPSPPSRTTLPPVKPDALKVLFESPPINCTFSMFESSSAESVPMTSVASWSANTSASAKVISRSCVSLRVSAPSPPEILSAPRPPVRRSSP